MALEFLHKHLGSTEEDARRAQEELFEYYREIGIKFSEELESYQNIKKIIDEFDLAYRTVDSYVCSTRENAEMAKSELT